jgi:[ribosomal protein S5]-alanine N-acetyltransferase
MTLQTPRLLLRPFGSADLENVFAGLSHPEVIRHYGVSFTTLEASQEQMDWYASIEREGTGLWRAICAKEDGKFLGAIGLNSIVREHAKGEIGFWLMPEHQGHGYISEVLPILLEHGFGTMGLHRIEAEVETDNAASAKVLVKAGFVHEGTLRECEWKDSRWISLDVFAKLAGRPNTFAHAAIHSSV